MLNQFGHGGFILMILSEEWADNTHDSWSNELWLYVHSLFLSSHIH